MTLNVVYYKGKGGKHMKISKKSKIKFLRYISEDLADDGLSRDIIENIIADVSASKSDGEDVDELDLYDVLYGDEQVDPSTLS